MKKRGAGHVEFISAFVLFIGFLIFVVLFFRPTKTNIGLENTLDYAISELTNEASQNVEIYSIKINNLGASTPSLIAIDSSEIDANKKVRAEKLDGERVSAKTQGAKTLFETEGLDKIRLIFGKGIIEEDSGITGNVEIDEELYTIAISDQRNVISEKEMEIIAEKYESNYLELKYELGIPEGIEFGFSLDLSGDLKIKSNNEPNIAGEVYAKEVRKEILREDGKLEYGELVIRIW